MFEITITETAEQEQKFGKDWGVVGQRLPKDEEIEGSTYSSRNELRSKVLSGEPIKFDVYGYSPEITKTATVKREIFRQSVEQLDLTAVICAVNKITSVEWRPK